MRFPPTVCLAYEQAVVLVFCATAPSPGAANRYTIGGHLW